tara:strand:- start:13653 stop:14501 length:849 start_codon:yes stop_codon:yes gene_type:complete
LRKHSFNLILLKENQLIKIKFKTIFAKKKMKIEKFIAEINDYKNRLINHNLYKKINSINDLKLFMEGHVYAVWDFMSLVKKLQQNLTCTNIPWFPSKTPLAARLINDIVLCEETDQFNNGKYMSHFEMYISSMIEIGASTKEIINFVKKLEANKDLNDSILKSKIPNFAKDFMIHTFNIINSNKNHVIAAAFTFGREDLIPDIFVEMVKSINNKENIKCNNLIYYLERHIEVDSEEHGPMALKMIKELCGNDEKKWNEALNASILSLEQRINLWNGIEKSLN